MYCTNTPREAKRKRPEKEEVNYVVKKGEGKRKKQIHERRSTIYVVAASCVCVREREIVQIHGLGRWVTQRNETDDSTKEIIRVTDTHARAHLPWRRAHIHSFIQTPLFTF